MQIFNWGIGMFQKAESNENSSSKIEEVPEGRRSMKIIILPLYPPLS